MYDLSAKMADVTVINMKHLYMTHNHMFVQLLITENKVVKVPLPEFGFRGAPLSSTTKSQLRQRHLD